MTKQIKINIEEIHLLLEIAKAKGFELDELIEEIVNDYLRNIIA